jgi:hypothetical protein
MMVGDIIVCIDNVGYELELTIGKSYKLLKLNEKRLSPISIENDLGEIYSFDDDRFILLSELRSIKLNQLGI